MLKTKSIQKRKHSSDGLRVCVMRRIRPEYQFDIWMPILSPSEQLLTLYIIDKKIDWKTFKPLFLEEQKNNTKIFNWILQLAKKENVTFLCWEDTGKFCHRSLLANQCKKLNSKLKIKLD